MPRRTFHPSRSAWFRKAGCKHTCSGLETTALSAVTVRSPSHRPNTWRLLCKSLCDKACVECIDPADGRSSLPSHPESVSFLRIDMEFRGSPGGIPSPQRIRTFHNPLLTSLRIESMLPSSYCSTRSGSKDKFVSSRVARQLRTVLPTWKSLRVCRMGPHQPFEARFGLFLSIQYRVR
jgi:hypothetical protein